MIISDNNISKAINGFIKMGIRCGFANEVGDKIALFRHDDEWSLELVESGDARLKDAQTSFDFPENLPRDEIDAVIELAGMISYKLHDWSRGKTSALGVKKFYAKLTPAERSARAKKAVEARIAKYGQRRREG